jgi:hypothetical protein
MFLYLCSKSLIIAHHFTIYGVFDFVYGVHVPCLGPMPKGAEVKERVEQGAATALDMFHAAYRCHYNATFKEQHGSLMVDE